MCGYKVSIRQQYCNDTVREIREYSILTMCILFIGHLQFTVFNYGDYGTCCNRNYNFDGKYTNSYRKIEPELIRRMMTNSYINKIINSGENIKGLELLNK